ncbi:MAG TPA: substrate-binding domain-containing protein [Friedmanniella sp.]
MSRVTSLKMVALGGAALLLAACSGGAPATQDDDASGDATASGDITIGFSISTMQNPFFVSMADGIKEAEASEGVTVIVSDAADDASKQANDVLNFISQGVDAVVLNPTDSDAVISSVQALNDAGIPVLTVDRRTNGGTVVTHIGTDNVVAGEIAAKTMFDAIGGTGKVAILEGVPGASSARDRQTGFDNVLQDYPDIEIVASQTANYQRSEGLSVAQNLLQAHPDLTAILSMNDEMALGAVEAIRSAGLEATVRTIGIDGGDDAIQAVKDGTLVATIAQQSKLMGSDAIKNAVKVAKGETVAEDQPVDVIVIDASNVDEYLK